MRTVQVAYIKPVAPALGPETRHEESANVPIHAAWYEYLTIFSSHEVCCLCFDHFTDEQEMEDSSAAQTSPLTYAPGQFPQTCIFSGIEDQADLTGITVVCQPWHNRCTRPESDEHHVAPASFSVALMQTSWSHPRQHGHRLESVSERSYSGSWCLLVLDHKMFLRAHTTGTSSISLIEIILASSLPYSPPFTPSAAPYYLPTAPRLVSPWCWRYSRRSPDITTLNDILVPMRQQLLKPLGLGSG